MKKNYTLKLVLAMLIVVLVSLVSFVGVYKGKNLLKDYSLGKDFEQRKVATFTVVEDETTTSTEETTEETTEESAEAVTEETTENTAEEETSESTEDVAEETSEVSSEENTDTATTEQTTMSEEDKIKEYKKSKNIISKRLTSMNSEEYDIRLDDQTGKLIIEVPSDMDSNYLYEIVSKGKAQILNQSTDEVLVDSNGFKEASATLDTTTYSTPIVLLNIKFNKDAKNALKNANPNYTDSEGAETSATFAFTLDEETLYSDSASTFIEAGESGELELVLGQGSEGEELEEYYQTALALTSIIKSGEISTEYELESLELVSSNINIKTIVIIAIIVGVLMLLFAVYKFKKNGILPVISLVGLLATTLLVLRYTNVKITVFTILGLAVIVLINYIFILKHLGSNKSFKEDFIEILNILVPCIIVAVVFCCAPYLQLASFGMTIFWGVIVMCIYNAIITRIFINK